MDTIFDCSIEKTCRLCGKKFYDTLIRSCTDIENFYHVCGKCKRKHKIKNSFELLAVVEKKEND